MERNVAERRHLVDECGYDEAWWTDPMVGLVLMSC